MNITNFLKSVFVHHNEDPKGIYKNIIHQAWKEVRYDRNWWDIKVTTLDVFNNKVILLSNKEKAGLMVYLVKSAHRYYNGQTIFSSEDSAYQKLTIKQAFLAQLSRMRIELDEEDMVSAISTATRYNTRNAFAGRIPLKGILNQIQKKYPDGILPPALNDILASLAKKIKKDRNFCTDIEASKLSEQIHEIQHPSSEDQQKVVLFPGDIEFSQLVNEDIAKMPDTSLIWYQLITLCKKASGAKPSNKYLADSKALIQQIGADLFIKTVNEWFEFLIGLKERELRMSQIYGTQTYQMVSLEFLPAVVTESTKGLIWMCASLKNNALLNQIGRLAERAYRKIPGQGQTSTAIGNACLYTLCKTEGLEGIGHLSRLKTRIKLPSTVQLIEKYLQQAASNRNLPVTAIEDMAVDQLGLVNEERFFKLGDYQAKLKIEKVGKVNISWIKSDGTVQKSDPTVIKEKYPKELKQIKLTSKQIETSLSAQRDRLDSSFKSQTTYTWDHFQTYYANHGLLSYLCHRLIWNFEIAGVTKSVYWLNKEWVDQDKNIVPIIDIARVWLWHPALVTLGEVQSWRAFLIEKEIQQPIKQAFREIYLLTDAELNTRTYSNRMASHLLKQHQFSSLAKVRNWKYTIQGQFDNGADGTAHIDLPACGLIAAYWTEGVDAQDAVSDLGIFNYVSTDQVRFSDKVTKEPIQLIDVPVQVFSEVMRDVDLFVGVTSVGNDPEWRDNGGLPNYRDYWQAYSFGELNEAGKSRKEILERLLPRLKIAKVATLRDKFLVVEGTKRTYKIHLGSSNILMEPNDQYLCIVPDRSKKNTAENLFLPFEGDNGLSVIISKAFLLAEDNKISDPSILSQINC